MSKMQYNPMKLKINGSLALSVMVGLLAPALGNAATVTGMATISINNPALKTATISSYYPAGTIVSAYFDSTHDNDTITLVAPTATTVISATSTSQFSQFPVQPATPPATTNPANRFPQATTMDTTNTAVGQIGLSGAMRNTNAVAPYTNYLQNQDFSVQKINGVWNLVTHDNVGGAETLYQLAAGFSESLDANGKLKLSGNLIFGNGTNAYTINGVGGAPIPNLSPWVNFLQVVPAQQNTVVGFFNLQPLPAVPTNLSASVASATQINLTWTDNAINETAQYLERCTGAACTNFAQIAAPATNATSYNNTGLTANTTYRYRIRAHGPTGDSAYSSIITTATAAPAAPSGLSSSAKSNVMVTLTWVDASNNEANFKLERCKGASCTAYSQIATPAANATSYSNTGLTANSTYKYRIRASNIIGNSAYSNIYTVTTNP
ncbi:MAG: fibronectin type III domain-containing protein [Methylococcales bacterium]